MDLGINFSPLNQDSANQRGGAPRVQEAIKTLSTAQPHMVGAASPIPQGLMQGMGSAGVGGSLDNSGGLEQLLRKLFGLMPQGGQDAATMAQPGTGGSAPAPRVIPGIDGGMGAETGMAPQAPQAMGQDVMTTLSNQSMRGQAAPMGGNWRSPVDTPTGF